jgi:hypothetical protein
MPATDPAAQRCPSEHLDASRALQQLLRPAAKVCPYQPP